MSGSTPPTIPLVLASPRPPASTHAPIPTEILHQIFKYLKRPEILKCLTVSYVFYDLATLFIYKKLVVDVTKKNTFFAMSQLRGIDKLVKARLAGRKPLPPLPTSPTDPEPQPEVDPLTSRFFHTTHLTIETHPDCFDLPPVHMPNLQTLRVQPQPGKAACVELCWSERPWPSKPCTCAIIANLRPPKIILGNADTGLYSTASGLWGADGQPFPPPFVKQIVYYVGQDTDYDTPNFLSNLPDTLERFSLVFQPKDRSIGGEWRRYKGIEPDHAAFAELAIPCCGEAKVVEIVGIEDICAMWLGPGKTVEFAKLEIRDRVIKRLVRSGVDEVAARAKAEAIVFMGRAEFNEREKREER